MKKILLYILFLPLLISCYSQKIYLNADKKSGKMTIEYNLDDDFFQLLSIALENFSTDDDNYIDPTILLDEELFKEYFKENMGDIREIKLKKVSIDLTNGYKGYIEIDFFNLEKLMDRIPQGMTNLLIEKKGYELTISQIIDMKKMDPDNIFKDFIIQQKEDDLNFYNKLTQKAKFDFILSTALPIKKTEGVELSANKKTASYSFKINDLINNDGKILKFLITL